MLRMDANPWASKRRFFSQAENRRLLLFIWIISFFRFLEYFTDHEFLLLYLPMSLAGTHVNVAMLTAGTLTRLLVVTNQFCSVQFSHLKLTVWISQGCQSCCPGS